MFVVDQDNTTSIIDGILNDWDLCKHKDDLELESTQNGRSVGDINSDQFLSSNVLFAKGHLGFHVWRLAQISAQAISTLR